MTGRCLLLFLFFIIFMFDCAGQSRVLMDDTGRNHLPYSFLSPLKKVWIPEKYVRKKEFRGFWISTVGNLDFPRCKNAAGFRAAYTRLIRNAAAAGFNAVIFQVRPCGDAFYPSKYNPWSRYLSGKEGFPLEPGFDPLTFMIAEAHRYGLEFHAWLNPYRVIGYTKLTKSAYLRTLHPANFAVKHPDKVLSVPLKNGGNMLFFNPGDPDVLMYLIHSIQELLRYTPDAIHIDDYFYPYEPMGNQDLHTFQRYAQKGMTIDAFRRYSTDRLVQSIFLLIKRYNALMKTQIKFGISPFGIWANKPRPKPKFPDAIEQWKKLQTSPDGSETKGHQSYFELYADTRKWVKNGWVDYIVPQIYWGFSNPAASYASVVDWWVNNVRGTNVTLYIGVGVYRMGVNSDCLRQDELANQLRYIQKYPEVKGVSFFSGRSIFQTPPPARKIMLKHIFETYWGGKYNTEK
ncbi:MAG: family 10 glycosylhydrolase [Lentisphaeria bacterium]|nr:family 10 glycosylhydrolase [Lentisphaeria bacterium]